LKIRNSILTIILLILISNLAAFGQNVTITVPDSSGAPGDTATVPVNISNTTGRGIIAVDALLRYDPGILSFVDAGPGTINESWQVVFSETTPGAISIMMIFDAQQDPLSGSGTFLNIRFLVRSNARIGAKSALSFDKEKTMLNEGQVGIAIQDGVFTVSGTSPEPGLEGDVNGDDRVDHLDLLKLILAYGKSIGESGYNPSADFDDDRRVDRADLVIFLRNFGATR
jgi:hypothetical protein